MDDERIIELFFARSEEAITALEVSYGRLCHSVSLSILGDSEDAEECVNDAYLAMWNRIPPERPAPLRAYLLKIVRNISLGLYSKRTAAKRGGGYKVALEELDGCLASPDTVDSALESAELARMIEEFLDTLTEENRVIFLRRYWFADSYLDISERVGLTEKNVSVRLTRIRGQLRRYLTEWRLL